MNIVNIKVNELKAYENNPRNNESAIEAVANSIKEFGFKVPIIIDKNNVIVAGHTRALAAEQIGLNEVPCIVADDLTPEQIKSFRLVDNKTAELAEWDFAKLEQELEELTAFDVDMAQFGFDESIFEDTEPTKTYKNEELSEEDFAEEKYQHECPRCGFLWSDNT